MSTSADKLFQTLLPKLKGLSWQTLSFRSKLSLFVYSVAFLSITIIGFYGYQHASYAYRSRATELIDGYTSEVSIKIQDFMQMGRNDVRFLNNLYSLRRYSYWRDIGDDKQMAYWQTITLDTLRNFSMAYDYVYKIRLLDNQGQELLGIRRDKANGNAHILATEELQNQATTVYFKETQKLQLDSDIYVSAIDLNHEHGMVEHPLVPIVRLTTPIISEVNVRYGMIVYNLLAEKFFDLIRIANKNNQGRIFYLIDQQGQFLYHPDSDKMFGTLLGHDASFEQDYPAVLAKMLKTQGHGILKTDHDIIAYRPIYPNQERHDVYWLLVGVIEEKTALAELNNFVSLFTVLFIAVAVLVITANRYMLIQVVRPLQFVTKQLQSLGRGEVIVESFAYAGQDELKLMLDSTQVLVSNMEQLAQQADAIGKGDFSGYVKVLSEQDRLGSAINDMTYMLRVAKLDEENRNWLRDGLEQLSKALTGDLSSGQLADIALSILGRYLQTGRGVFYTYNEPSQILELIGSYMYSERNHLGNAFKLGEGAIGQVAREKKPIFLTTLNLTQAPVVTGTSSSPPLYTYTYPLLREDNLLGVLELSGFDAFDKLKHLFLQEAMNIVASFLYVVLQREQIKRLLGIAEAAEKEAREQSKQLQVINAQMEEQQQQLQQQTEELQQANAQMEEQQQQLQQQTEELQQTNAQMEEAQQQLEQQNRILVESQQELDARSKQLELSSQYKSEFLANMSHELRTPLNSIILLSKMMASNSDRHLNEEEVHHAEIIHNAGQELLRLINDVLDLSKIEAGQMELHLSTISSEDFLHELYELFEHSAKEKHLELKIEDHLQGQFVSDSNRLSQILRNLLSNALKFTKVGSITLSIQQTHDGNLPIRVSVKDTGIGIPEAKRKVIFEAFQQADGSISRQYGGTGLGLSISLRFAQLLGGTIELNSIVGQGSEFSVLLPQTLSANQSAVPKKLAAPVTAESKTKVADLKKLSAVDDREQLNPKDAVILLIDDDPLFGQALLEINRKLGYKTLLAATGKEGLTLARQYLPSGILLDLGLPDMDGSEVLHELKTQPNVADIPVYVVSGREKNAALMQEGLLGYLQKPVDVQQISQAEAELLTFIRRTATAQTIFVVENGGITTEQVRNILGSQLVTVLKVDIKIDPQSLKTLFSQHSCCLAIVDLNGQSVTQALEVAKKLRSCDEKLNFIFLGQHALTEEEDAQLHQYSDSIIIKASQSEQRLLKNIERFLAKAADGSDNATSLAVKEQQGNGKRLIGKHILVVDDDARNLFVITAALEKEGAKVSGVLNGKRALEFLQNQTVDMVFMDIMMPEMDGYQTITALRHHSTLVKIPIVALTAKALPADREKALAAGADDFLAKPADYDLLINMASTWCAHK